MEIEVGKITHYYTNIGVGVVELSDTLKSGDTIHIQGAITDIVQTAASMQIDNQPVESAGAGEAIGLKVDGRVREGDKVYRFDGNSS